MTARIVLLKFWILATAFILVRDFIRSPRLDSIAFPGAAVLFLCFGIWEMGQ